MVDIGIRGVRAGRHTAAPEPLIQDLDRYLSDEADAPGQENSSARKKPAKRRGGAFGGANKAATSLAVENQMASGPNK